MIKKQFLYTAILGICLFSASCEFKAPYEKMTDSKDGAMIYIAKATAGVQNLNLTAGATERTFTFGVGFGAVGLPANDIVVSLINDSHAIDSINSVQSSLGLELYQKFPADAFKMDKMKLTIPCGGASSELTTITYYPAKFDRTANYLLALSISDASSYAVNPATKTLYLAAPKH
jgi:hypothetical protein